MKELEKIEHMIADLGKPLPDEIMVDTADLKAVCMALREHLEAANPEAYPSENASKQFVADKKLITRINQYGKGLSEVEQDILETSLGFIEDGRELSDKMRKIMQRVDDRKVGG